MQEVGKRVLEGHDVLNREGRREEHHAREVGIKTLGGREEVAAGLGPQREA